MPRKVAGGGGVDHGDHLHQLRHLLDDFLRRSPAALQRSVHTGSAELQTAWAEHLSFDLGNCETLTALQHGNAAVPLTFWGTLDTGYAGAPKPSIAPRVTGRSMGGRTNDVGDRRRLPVTCRSLCC
eukprot:3042119-Prymnesium_polylepis.1